MLFDLFLLAKELNIDTGHGFGINNINRISFDKFIKYCFTAQESPNNPIIKL